MYIHLCTQCKQAGLPGGDAELPEIELAALVGVLLHVYTHVCKRMYIYIHTERGGWIYIYIYI